MSRFWVMTYFTQQPGESGTRRAQTDASGVLEQTCSSLPYGDQLSCVSQPDTGGNISPYIASLTAPTEHHFTGKERDSESGNDYFEARYYSSAMGRFISPDWTAKVEPVPYAKLDDPQTLNLYAYVGNNPMTRDDDDGHDSIGPQEAMAQFQQSTDQKPTTTKPEPQNKKFQACDAQFPTDPATAKLSQLIAAEATKGLNSKDEMAAIGYSATDRVDWYAKNPRTNLNFFGATDKSLDGVINRKQYGSVDSDMWVRASNPQQFNVLTPRGSETCSFLKNVYSVASDVKNVKAHDPFISEGGTFGMRTKGHGTPGGKNFFQFKTQIPGSGNTFFGVK
jgi:RHS repeat-associated protein